MTEIFTIGHSNHPLEVFLQLLHTNNIQVVVDVRSAPYSKYVPRYNKQQLETDLKNNNYRYLFMGDCIGGKPDDPAVRKSNGTVDYEKLAGTEKFLKGIDRLVKGIADGWKIALLCAEENPANCHRHQLIARELEYKRNVAVMHIRADAHLLRAKELLQIHPRQMHLF
jgi:uncharacterized protein (DUF488 family)